MLCSLASPTSARIKHPRLLLTLGFSFSPRQSTAASPGPLPAPPHFLSLGDQPG